MLYVDDEHENLRAFELSFRREFTIRTASSGRDALEMINEQPVAVVLSDHRMPGMTGTEFLTRVREIEPRTIRLLVTAYGDATTLADAVNNGQIYRYVPKPWQPEEMATIVRQAIDLFALTGERESLLGDLTALHDLSVELGRERAVGPLVGRLSRTTVEEFGFDAATVVLFDRSTTGIELVDSFPEGNGVAAFLRSCRDVQAVVQMLQASAGAVLTSDAIDRHGPSIRGMLTEISADEILVAALRGREATLGVIVVDNRRGGKCFRAAECSLLEGVASQAAIAIENARMVSELSANEADTVNYERLAALGAVAIAAREGAESAVRGEGEWLTSLADVGESILGDSIGDSRVVVNLGDLAAEVVCSRKRSGAAVALRARPAGEGEAKVEGPRAELRAIIELLVGEAIERWSHAGDIRVDVSGGALVTLEVSALHAAGSVDLESLAEVAGGFRMAGAALLAQRVGGTIEAGSGLEPVATLRFRVPRSHTI